MIRNRVIYYATEAEADQTEQLDWLVAPADRAGIDRTRAEDAPRSRGYRPARSGRLCPRPTSRCRHRDHGTSGSRTTSGITGIGRIAVYLDADATVERRAERHCCV